jgi:phytoene dehydrogenase-like protein
VSHAATDAVVVGAGPNGLAAAIALARAGRSVTVFEGNETIGGGCRSAELTLPGFVHDVCSAIHPLAAGSPFFAELPLERHGLEWIEPPVALAHPLDDGSAALVLRDLDETAAGMGADGSSYARLVRPLARDWSVIVDELLGPLPLAAPFRHPIAVSRFGLLALQPATWIARRFRTDAVRGLFAGVAAHSFLPLRQPGSAAFGLALLAAAHAVGWPLPRGGSQRIVDALAAHLVSDLGGSIVTGQRIARLVELPPHDAALLDVTPRQLLAMAGDRISGGYAAQLRRFRYGPGSFKVDLAIDGPIPWRNADLLRAGTVHLGGTADEVTASERAVARGQVSAAPFVLLAQQSLFDPSRAPQGRHTVWAYCHVPNGSTTDMTEPIIGQIERFAPGFRERVLALRARGPRELEAENPNYIGGDINGGLQNLPQLYTRPAIRLDPYATPDPRLFICSSSTPPGGGVHGICGANAAVSALKRAFA